MKVLLFTSLFAVLIAMAVCQLSIKEASKNCMSETKVTQDEIRAFYTSKTPSTAATGNIKCHVKCVMEKVGHLKNGVYNVDQAIKDMKTRPDAEQIEPFDEKAFPKCKDQKGADDCETAFKLYTCLKEFKA